MSVRATSRPLAFGLAVLPAAAFALALLWSPPPARAATIAGSWTPGGVRAALGGGDALTALPVGDGVGGVFVVWTSHAAGDPSNTLRVSRVLDPGTPDPTWPPDGVILGPETGAVIARAAAGGGLVVVSGSRAWRIGLDGQPAAGWPAEGVSSSVKSEYWRLPLAAIDDSAGVWLVGEADTTIGGCGTECNYVSVARFYVTRLTPDGAAYPGWEAPGRLVVTGEGTTNLLSSRLCAFRGGVALVYSATISSRYAGTDYYSYYVRLFASGLGEVTVVEASPGAWADNNRFACDSTGRCFVSHGVYMEKLTVRRIPSGAPWTGPVWTLPDHYTHPEQLFPDATGGVFMRFFGDTVRGEPWSPRAVHLLPNGSLDPPWGGFGRLLPDAGSAPERYADCGDGLGGYLVAVAGADGLPHLVVSRFAPDGTLPPGWGAGGTVLCDEAGSVPSKPGAASDALGNAFVTWIDRRSGSPEVFAQKLGNDSPVPALVRSASATWNGEAVELEWRLEAVSSVTVERGTDGVAWEPLGAPTVTTDGDQQLVRFVDRSPARGSLARYRLRASADAWAGGEVTVDVPAAARLQLAVWPNPLTASSRLRWSTTESGPVRITVHDLAGRARFTTTRGVARGDETFGPGALGELSPGVYWLTLTTGAEQARTRIVVLPR